MACGYSFTELLATTGGLLLAVALVGVVIGYAACGLRKGVSAK